MQIVEDHSDSILFVQSPFVSEVKFYVLSLKRLHLKHIVFRNCLSFAEGNTCNTNNVKEKMKTFTIIRFLTWCSKNPSQIYHENLIEKYWKISAKSPKKRRIGKMWTTSGQSGMSKATKNGCSSIKQEKHKILAKMLKVQIGKKKMHQISKISLLRLTLMSGCKNLLQNINILIK